PAGPRNQPEEEAGEESLPDRAPEAPPSLPLILRQETAAGQTPPATDPPRRTVTSGVPASPVVQVVQAEERATPARHEPQRQPQDRRFSEVMPLTSPVNRGKEARRDEAAAVPGGTSPRAALEPVPELVLHSPPPGGPLGLGEDEVENGEAAHIEETSVSPPQTPQEIVQDPARRAALDRNADTGEQLSPVLRERISRLLD